MILTKASGSHSLHRSSQYKALPRIGLKAYQDEPKVQFRPRRPGATFSDGYNQLDLLLGKGPSKRHELFYFGGPQLGAVRLDNYKFRFDDQPQGWLGPKVMRDMPIMVNIRQDPFEWTPSIGGQSLNDQGGGYMNDFFGRDL